ncbi:SUKH-3 domain-containing protein [Streptomyces sp. XM4193]|uniref:SUKH-3 domain-containing protein n=1 Tax=Streptomyces sp. XM4193 TaxID=2929782 RepID=UPI001FF92EC8|nr:SUKH-3 domain-containing protein [Streptomyces sp. XM4193]MCK1796852.1 SUKH-3 domain-containing protein [Streptomyces sp. XM4193]
MTTRFSVAADAALRAAGWQPGRRDMRQAEIWADTLRAHTSPGGHRHALFPAAVEAWAEFGGLLLVPTAPGRQIAPTPFVVDPAHGLYWARTLTELGRALDTEIAPLGAERGEHPATHGTALLAMDIDGRVYSLDHSGDYYLGADIETALTTLVDGVRPARLTLAETV